MSTNAGGPAFPCENDEEYFPGMSLRDWFAGQIVSEMLDLMKRSGHNGTPDKCRAELAEEAYLLADAMLAEREKRT